VAVLPLPVVKGLDKPIGGGGQIKRLGKTGTTASLGEGSLLEMQKNLIVFQDSVLTPMAIPLGGELHDPPW